MGRSAKRENGDRMPETTCYLLLTTYYLLLTTYYLLLTTYYLRLTTYDLRLYLKSLLAYGPEQLFGKMNAVFF